MFSDQHMGKADILTVIVIGMLTLRSPLLYAIQRGNQSKHI